ncbi:MAG: hypothetical protein H6708_05740 [Kofleriaceae bacterium]|nr:hypothetical protein [Kofleriaceae bacterium]
MRARTATSLAAALAAAAAAATLLAGCLDVPPFSCDTDEQCGTGGRCEDDHACSFADPGCHAGRRYGGEDDPMRANVCVGDLSGAIAQVAAGSDHACARGDDGRLWCWGDNQEGGLGRIDVTAAGTPAPVAGLPAVTDVDGGEYHTCAVAGGRVWCWGFGGDGELGDGTTNSRATPGQVPDLDGIVEVALGEQHSCARDGAGAVWCWGRNADRETGKAGMPTVTEPGRSTASRPPTPCSPAARSAACSAAARPGAGARTPTARSASATPSPSTCRCGSTAWPAPPSWRSAASTSAADGRRHRPVHRTERRRPARRRHRHQQTSPVAVAGLDGVVELVALDWSTCARDAEGTVTCWGEGGDGQLGSGDDDRLKPEDPVTLPRPAVSLAAGENHACAQTDDGCVWCWGSDAKGQLGDGRGDDSGAVQPTLLSCF